MRLIQPEIIQLLRKRAQMNQGVFGAKAFNTSYESGRTKVKNIELGKQTPTREDLKKMALVLGVSPADLIPEERVDRTRDAAPQTGLTVSQECLEKFPGLAVYLDMLNKAVKIDDAELIDYITGKVAAVFRSSPQSKAVNL